MSLDIKNVHAFNSTPWPRYNRQAKETLKNGEEVIIPNGAGIPKIISIIYGAKINVVPFSGKFNFLARDSKIRNYDPGSVDGMVFNGWKSVDKFKKDAKELISLLNKRWVELGGSLKMDPDRKFEFPDSEHLYEKLVSHDSAAIDFYKKNYEEVSYIVSNIDILKKAAIVRSVSPGWWIVSYDGKKAPDLKKLIPAANCYLKAAAKLMKSDKFQKIYASTLSDMGDPYDTAVGWPFYSAEVKEGIPISKMRMLKLFKDCFKLHPYDFEGIKKEMSARVAATDRAELAEFVFAIASIRRMQYGFKWRHVCDTTPAGLVMAGDTRGDNTVRVAYAACYAHNLLISPFQAVVKTLRKCGVGQYHDGEFKRATLAALKKYKPYMIEADYGNYDRTMPIDLVQYLFNGIADLIPHSDYWKQVIRSLHYDVPLIWPDHVGTDDFGWIFKPDSVALLSGLKITSEEGTIVNSVVVGQSYLDAGLLTEEQLINVYSSGLGESNFGAFPNDCPLFLIQSDDTLLIDTDIKRLFKVSEAFKVNSKAAGIKATVEIGDRFLMRHCFNGNDSPLAARIWQNTLQNEEPYTDPLKMVVGLSTRTDGAAGFRTVDAFGLGAIRGMTKAELLLTTAVMESLVGFLSTATVVNRPALQFVNDFLMLCRSCKVRNGLWFPSEELAHNISKLRVLYVQELAKRELENLNLDLASGLTPELFMTLIYQLHKDANIPSQALLLSMMQRLDPRIAQAITSIQGKENAFYKYAMQQLGCPITVF